MRGLRKQESSKFCIFFALIQEEAAKKNAVFFADAGDGNDLETPDMECENVMGWLIPDSMISDFQPSWETSTVDDSWSDFFTWAIWEKRGEKLTIHFE